MGILKGFKEFLLKGDLITIAVGLVMALAVTALINALVEYLIMPIIAAIVGKPSFNDLTFTINDSVFQYGSFITAVITFVSISAAVYFFIVIPYKAYQDMRGVSAKTRACPECATTISVAAKRCPSCTQPVLPEPGAA
jgi:large conductance mechanosensitive channel